MREQNSEFLLACFYLRPFRPRIRDMVKVINRETARDGILVLSATILEGGMEKGYGQLLLQSRFKGFKLVLGELATMEGFQGIFYLGTYFRHLRRIECFIEGQVVK